MVPSVGGKSSSKMDIIWQAYEAALCNGTYDRVALALDLSPAKLAELRQDTPEVENAIQAAWAVRKRAGATPEGLNDELTELWRALSGQNADTKQKALMLLTEGGETMRQRLFVHALSETAFDIPRCCKELGVTKKLLNKWASDPQFVEMLEEIQFRKQNLIESKLLQRVYAGSEKAIIFAAGTALRDRGYGQSIEVTGQVQHIHGMLDLRSLDLEPEIQNRILEKVQESGRLDSDGLIVESPSQANPVGLLGVL